MIDAAGHEKVYPVSDDSILLLKAVDASQGDVLDMCTGTGIIGLNAAKFADSVTLADVSDEALKAVKENADSAGIKNIKIVKSDLFRGLGGDKFDVIFINPPYLPGEAMEGDYLDAATIGGREGYELTKRFILEAPGHLRRGGRVFMILSTRYHADEVYAAMDETGFDHKVLDTVDFFFERIMLVEMYESRRNNDI